MIIKVKGNQSQSYQSRVKGKGQGHSSSLRSNCRTLFGWWSRCDHTWRYTFTSSGCWLNESAVLKMASQDFFLKMSLNAAKIIINSFEPIGDGFYRCIHLYLLVLLKSSQYIRGNFNTSCWAIDNLWAFDAYL